VLHGLGELLITLGLVVLLFVVYEVYITNIFSAAKQTDATQAMTQRWHNDRGRQVGVAAGQGFAVMYVPALGADYHFTIVEGTSQQDLAIGPGHYTGTAMPGRPGNFAVAGHRVGKGAPFNDIDLVKACDSIVVETDSSWFVYRKLPEKGQVAGWKQSHGNDPRCQDVNPLGGPYSDTYGQEIVPPSEHDVVAPVPHHPEATLSKGQQVALMTLTTCHPKFSDAKRLIVHAVLVKQYAKNPKAPDAKPPELKETS
jgi:sortase (surface protein transpeptidase)